MNRSICLALGLILFCSLTAYSQSRLMIGAGGGFQSEESSFHMSAALDAPQFIREHLPLELVIGFAAPFDQKNRASIEASDLAYVNAWPRAYYYYLNPHYTTSEFVRFYAVGRSSENREPDGLELGAGIGNYQIFSDEVMYSNGHKVGSRVETVWGVNGFVRYNILPTHPSGMFVEADIQHALRGGSHFQVDTAILQLGWRLPI
jgi:hypothetical protein